MAGNLNSKKVLWFFGLVLVVSIFPFPAYAAASMTMNSSVTYGAPLVIALGVAYVTRRMSIGGWLFYYYLQLYCNVLITVLLSIVMIDNLQPTGWEDKTLYTLFVLSIVPIFFVKAIEGIFATRLLVKSQRNEKNVKVLRYILLASVIIDVASVAINYYHFHDNVPFSIFALITSSIWCLYFFRSYRVDYVLSRWTGVWIYDSFKEKKAAEPEKV
jgi:hypothetical protein